jgi:O-antigen ligase
LNDSRARINGMTVTTGFAWAGVALVLVFVFFVGGTYPFLGSPIVRALTQALLWAVIVGWMAAWIRRPWWAPRRETLLILGPGLAAGLLSVVGAQSRRMSIEAVYWAFLLVAVFLALTRISAHPAFRTRVRGLIVLLFLIVLFGYLAQLVVSWADWFQTVGRLSALPLHPGGASLTFGATPVVAMVLLTLGPPAAAILLSLPNGRVVVAVLGLLAAAEILATGSRSGYLAAGVEAILIVGMAGRSGVRGALQALPRWALGLAVVLAGALGIALLGATATRLLDAATLGERWAIWGSAITIWERSPWIGAGAGLWPYLRAGAYPTGSPSLVVPHAHNPAIQLLAETGVVGVVAVAIGIGLLVRALIRRAALPDVELRRVAIATLIGLGAFAADSILDDFVNLPCAVLTVALPVAWVLAGGEQPAGARRMPPRVPALASTALLAVIGVGGWQMNAAAITADQGVRAANAGDWSSAGARFSDAVAMDPFMPLYRIELATALSTLGDPNGAWGQLQVVGEADGSPTVLLNRAWTAYNRGDQADVVASIGRAYGRAAGDAAVLINIGSLAGQVGDASLATSAYADAIVASPLLAASQTLRDSPLYGDALARAIDLSAGSADRFAPYLIRAYGGSAEKVVAELRIVAPSAPRDRALAVALTLTGQASEAESLLVTRLGLDPVDGQTADLLARVSAEAGNAEEALHYGHWAQLVGVGSAAIGLTSESTISTVREAETSNLATNYPWVIYGRFAPSVMLPPNALAIPDR